MSVDELFANELSTESDNEDQEDVTEASAAVKIKPVNKSTMWVVCLYMLYWLLEKIAFY